jgi:polyribonucleotide nucleotidyltransferase
MQKKEFSMQIGGKTFTAEFSDLAERANGSAMIRYENTVILATAVMLKKEREAIDFFPLTVDFEEKFYAAGKIPGGSYVRRELKPSDDAILNGRIVDRTIRPLFDQQTRNETHIVTTVLSIDERDPDVLAVNAASLAIATSNIPWNGPVSAVRILKHVGSDEFIINPTYTERAQADVEVDLVACGKDGNITMIETVTKETSEDTFIKALKKASEEIEKIQEFQKKIIAEIGKAKMIMPEKKFAQEGMDLFEKEIRSKLDGAIFKAPGEQHIGTLKEEWVNLHKKTFEDQKQNMLAMDYYEEVVNEVMHDEALKGRRPDGRAMNKVRDIFVQAGGLSDMVHGSAIFYRGGTHVLSVVTLGSPDDSLIVAGIEEDEYRKRYIHHYNFPPSSVGEVGRLGASRRSIGHGALAEKALLPVLPPKEIFPYTIRVVSEVLASNGSSSMGSTCGSTIALMDAGVPITAPVAGIAMGLMMKDENTYKVLTDIQGPEDHHGDMDFKVTGTRKGITAIQMDIKVGGIPVKILEEALVDAKAAREMIIGKIEEIIPVPRPTLKPSAPQILTVQVKLDQIGLVIGPGGKTIKKMQEESGAEISIEEDGTVYIIGKGEIANKAKALVESLTHEFKVGEKFEGEVTKLFDFGALIRITPSTEGLVHVSEIAPFRLAKVEDVLALGDKVPVIIKELGEKDKISLSIKMVDPEYAARKGAKPSEGGSFTPRHDGGHDSRPPRRQFNRY